MRKNHLAMCQAFSNRKEKAGRKVPETGAYRWTIEHYNGHTYLSSYNELIAHQFPNGQIQLLDLNLRPQSRTTTAQVRAVQEYFKEDPDRIIKTAYPLPYRLTE